MAGLLVVLEGIDGSGKTTLRGRLAEALRAGGRIVVETKEPTDGPYGQKIRALAKTGRGAVTPAEELALFHEDRKIHVDTLVRPALARGEVVLQDRSYFSTIAYQGERGLDRDRIRRESEAIAPKPDVLLVLDLPVPLAEARIGARGAKDDFEHTKVLERLRDVFLALPEATIVDAARPADEVFAAALAAIRAKLR